MWLQKSTKNFTIDSTDVVINKCIFNQCNLMITQIIRSSQRHFVKCVKFECLHHILLYLAGIILYTFLHFDSTPAILTAIVIGVAIVIGGCAVVHNVMLWCKVSKVVSSCLKPIVLMFHNFLLNLILTLS